MEISNTIDETEAVVEQTTSFFSGILQKIQDAIPTVLVAVVIFIIGALLAKLLQKAVKRGMKRSNIDDTAIGFFQSLIRVILYTVLIVICLSILKVPMSSIVAVIGAAGLAIGLALQNSLSNLAGGFIILFSKPFKAGDYIETSGVSGTVESVGILYTRIITPDNKTVYIPNGTISASVISNYTEKKLRRLDLEFSISYESDFDKAQHLIRQTINESEIALKEPEPSANYLRIIAFKHLHVKCFQSISFRRRIYSFLLPFSEHCVIMNPTKLLEETCNVMQYKQSIKCSCGHAQQDPLVRKWSSQKHDLI